jgi:hypothetical protein
MRSLLSLFLQIEAPGSDWPTRRVFLASSVVRLHIGLPARCCAGGGFPMLGVSVEVVVVLRS